MKIIISCSPALNGQRRRCLEMLTWTPTFAFRLSRISHEVLWLVMWLFSKRKYATLACMYHQCMYLCASTTQRYFDIVMKHRHLWLCCLLCSKLLHFIMPLLLTCAEGKLLLERTATVLVFSSGISPTLSAGFGWEEEKKCLVGQFSIHTHTEAEQPLANSTD